MRTNNNKSLVSFHIDLMSQTLNFEKYCHLSIGHDREIKR